MDAFYTFETVAPQKVFDVEEALKTLNDYMSGDQEGIKVYNLPQNLIDIASALQDRTFDYLTNLKTGDSQRWKDHPSHHVVEDLRTKNFTLLANVLDLAMNNYKKTTSDTLLNQLRSALEIERTVRPYYHDVCYDLTYNVSPDLAMTWGLPLGLVPKYAENPRVRIVNGSIYCPRFAQSQ